MDIAGTATARYNTTKQTLYAVGMTISLRALSATAAPKFLKELCPREGR